LSFSTPGTYTVTLQVETPCCGIGTTTATINLIVDPIPTPAIVASTTDFCYGESVDLTASGGTFYTWDDGTVGSTNTVTPFVSTTYTVFVTNFECVGNTDITLAPTLVDVLISGNDQICNGDNTDLTANGHASATFQWSGGSTATTDVINVSPVTNTMYYVTAILNGCQAIDSLEVQVIQTNATVSASSILVCQGDEVMLTVDGGDYFDWSHGDTGDTVYVYPTVPTTFEVLVLWDSLGTISCNTQELLQIFVDLHPTPSITSVSNDTTVCTNSQISLSAVGDGVSLVWSTGETSATITPTILGDTTFTVNAISDLGCFSFDQLITVTTLTGITDVTLTPTNATCFGFTDGSVTSSVTGGIAPYTYLWSNGATTPDITNVGAGTYSLTVTADNGCTLEASGAQGEVTEFPDVIASITPDQTIVCQGEPVVLTVAGGTTYLWDSGETTPAITVNPTVQTVYTVVVVYDSLGISCSPSNLTEITVDVHPTPTMNFVSNDTLVCTFSTIGLSADGTGVGYIWSTGETTPTINPSILGDTIFIINAISDLGCLSFNDTIFITTIEGISDVQLTVTDATCFGFADGAITANVVSGVAPYTYLWSTGDTTSSITNLSAGDYTVVVTADNGCEFTNSTAPATINSFADIAAGFTLDPETGLPPLAVEFTNQTLNGVSYAWNFGDGGSSTEENPTHTYTSGGEIAIYMVATDVNGCTDTAYYSITLVGESSIIIPNIFTPNNDGSNDLLRITAQYIDSFSMTIFNRWGQVMAQIDWLGGGWDGTTMAGVAASEGVYYYLVNAVGFDGKIHEINGHFTLIR
jgi:gliding motility-associated-like protein